jgi:hypothetical protein
LSIENSFEKPARQSQIDGKRKRAREEFHAELAEDAEKKVSRRVRREEFHAKLAKGAKNKVT